ncbi:glycosyltransferase [Niabella yanshanensis]|uniref:Glycosyltransferase n=1 Tax=Niabella yanshanensis TaxID=577386 RepID=A0ABZ0W632_9BACT|nr:glycosyltransferase [Niabella yanshanensis]WQD38394.1 glycosyltransferase [Niabella yanshanensis]
MNKRIALISDHASPLAAPGSVDNGGQNIYVKELAIELAMQGCIVDIYTRWENSALPQVLKSSKNIRLIHIKAGPKKCIPKEQLVPYRESFAENMITFMKIYGIRYDVVHANFFISAYVAMRIKERMAIPYVITFHALGKVRRLHQGNNDLFPPERIQMEQLAINQADAIVAECPQDRQDLLEHYDAPADKITVIPCGVNIKTFFNTGKKPSRARLHIPADDFVILQLGRMVPRKGIENVIRATAVAVKKGVKCHLVIVGGTAANDAEHLRLKKLCEDLHINDIVSFVGQQEQMELKYYYSAADVFVSTPWYEPFGITPLEAMACETPVIGSRVGGIQFSVKEPETGLLVDPEQPQAVAEIFEDLSRNNHLLDQMGKNGLERVKLMFTWKRIAHEMQLMYEMVCPTAVTEISFPVQNRQVQYAGIPLFKS